MANYGLSELFIAMIEGFGGPRPTSFGPGELYEALVTAIENFAPGGGIVSSINAGTGISVNTPTGAVTVTNTGVTSFNTRTGAVTGVYQDVARFFTAAGDLYVGAGPASGVVYSLPNNTPGMYLQVATGGGGLVWGSVPVITTTFTSNAYTLALGDANSHQIASNGSTAATVTVPTHASVAFPVGTVITFKQDGTGKIKIAAAGGVTIESSVSGGFVSGTTGCRAQYSTIGLLQEVADSWVLSGDAA